MKKYYPTKWSGCNPIHEVKDWSKVRSLIRAARHGKNISPILIDGSLHNGNLLNGTHRAAANDLIMMLNDKKDKNIPLIDWVQYDPADYSSDINEAINNNDFETIDSLLDL